MAMGIKPASPPPGTPNEEEELEAAAAEDRTSVSAMRQAAGEVLKKLAGNAPPTPEPEDEDDETCGGFIPDDIADGVGFLQDNLSMQTESRKQSNPHMSLQPPTVRDVGARAVHPCAFCFSISLLR